MDKHGLETWLQVDGGISLETIERCAEAGADVFVAGSAVFSADDPDAMVAALREKAEAATPCSGVANTSVIGLRRCATLDAERPAHVLWGR